MCFMEGKVNLGNIMICIRDINMVTLLCARVTKKKKTLCSALEIILNRDGELSRKKCLTPKDIGW